jgi:hypothetical protein
MTPQELEAKVESFQGKNVTHDVEDLDDDEVFALLAWELWKDGMDWEEDLANLADGKTNLQYKNREDAINYLQTVFGY